ncbi:acyl-CoA dehydrogenase family protein [Parahaliea aestuarii]|uniref:Acyl-CoA dehydrogenase n=1 Tax=Parahaliea aestuarii TaxID=1852021 RepID=A0A5C8ZRM5_9GAMM|nr:acyl-CoA dehydrogenase family protein [Parahaliea aestuarii]TXS91025.1 acyl-CoA dehydrogenase [Parahaliea aestuarii]
MDFGFSSEQQDIRQLARQILGEQVSAESLKAYDEYAAPRFDRALWRTLSEAGLVAVPVSEAEGGGGFGFMELALLLEEVGRSIAPVPVLSHCVGGLMVLERFAGSDLKQRLLRPALAGELLLGAAVLEAGNEDPVNPLLTRAETSGDGLRLNGSKQAVAFARQSDYLLVAARHVDGVAVCFVDTRAPGVTLQDCQSTAFEPQAHVLLDNVEVAAEYVLEPSDGAAIMHWLGERLCAAHCAHQIGVADAAMRMAASYTSERQQFGVPVATFQAVGHRVADCYIDIECLRLATYQACSLLHDECEAGVETRIAKIWAGDTGHRVNYATQHVHGGMGIDRDYSLWRYSLWLRHNEMTLGGSSVHLAALGRSLAAGEGLFA